MQEYPHVYCRIILELHIVGINARKVGSQDYWLRFFVENVIVIASQVVFLFLFFFNKLHKLWDNVWRILHRCKTQDRLQFCICRGKCQRILAKNARFYCDTLKNLKDLRFLTSFCRGRRRSRIIFSVAVSRQVQEIIISSDKIKPEKNT